MSDESTFVEQTLETLRASFENARRDPKASEIGALLGLKFVCERYGVAYRTVEQAQRALYRRARQLEEETALAAVIAAATYG